MKKVISGLTMLLLLLTAFSINVEAQSAHNHAMQDSENVYDSLFARELNADAYGMRSYVMAFLYRGPNRDIPKQTADSLQIAHLKNISRLAEEGYLSLAGPFLDKDDLRGIYIFNVTSLEEAKRLTETDPAIKAGSLVMKLKPWYGPATLTLIPELNKKVQKDTF